MITILKKKVAENPLYRTTCKQCETEFTFNLSDTDEQIGHGFHETVIYCPVCGRTIYLYECTTEK